MAKQNVAIMNAEEFNENFETFFNHNTDKQVIVL